MPPVYRNYPRNSKSSDRFEVIDCFSYLGFALRTFVSGGYSPRNLALSMNYYSGVYPPLDAGSSLNLTAL